MKRFLLESAKVVGTATEESWSQVHTFSPTDKEKQKLRGHLLAVLSLAGLSEGVEAVAAGREVISRFHEEYYGNLEAKALERLRLAVERVRGEVEGEAEIEIGAAVVVGGVLYLAIAGQGQALLQRETSMGILLQGNGGVVTASGYLQDDDLFLLGTSGFFKTVAAGVVKAALASGSVADAAEALAPAVHGRPESGTVAAVIGKVQAEEIEPTPLDSPQEPVSSPAGDRIPVTSPLEKKDPLSVVKAIIGDLARRLQGLLGEKTIYLKREIQKRGKRLEFISKPTGLKRERSKKTVFTVVLVLLFLLGISVALGASQRRKLGLIEKTGSLFAEAQQKKEEAESLIELNPIRARELLLEAQGLSQKMDQEGFKSGEFETFKNELAQLLDQVYQEHQAEGKIFFDLELIKQEARGNDLAVSGGKVIVLDKEKKSVYEIGIGDKKSAIIAGGENLGGAYQIGAFLPNIFVLTEQGISQTDKITKKEKLTVEVDEAWGEIIDFWAFSGNLYLLDKQGEIWQYPATETGFGTRRRWLKGEADFSQAVSMAIDGSIWVLKSDGTIEKFTRGVKDFFRIAGLDKPLVNPTALYTDDDSENLYILDKGNARVVVVSKTGEYKATYLWEGVRTADDLVVSEEAKRILFLQGSKIYEIEIK